MNRRKRRRLLMLGSSAFASGGGVAPLVPPAQLSLFFAGQSLAEYPFIRGTPRVAKTAGEELRTHFGYSGGTMTSYASGDFFHDGSAQAAEDWTVRLDNLASGGSALLDISQGGSQIASSNYWWNTQDNTVATGNAADTAASPGPLWRALIAQLVARTSAQSERVSGFVWSQGTTDMTADLGVLATYKATLKALFAAVRVAAGWDLPIFILRFHRHQTAGDAGVESIRQIQREVVAEMQRVYFGADEYPHRFACAVQHTGAGITDGSNVITIADTTGLNVNDGIRHANIPIGAYIRNPGGVVLNTSITLDRRVDGVVVPANAVGSAAAQMIQRLDDVHLYPGSDGVEPLDGPGGTTNVQTEGFYAVFKALARRVAHIYNVAGIDYSEGPFVSGVEMFAGGIKAIVSLTHVGGTDFTLGQIGAARLEIDGVVQVPRSLVKLNATTIEAGYNAPFVGTLVRAWPVYGGMNRSYPSQFHVDDVGLYLQARSPVEFALPVAPPGAGPLVNTFLNDQLSTTDAAVHSFDGTAISGDRVIIAIGARGDTMLLLNSLIVNGVIATPLQAIGGFTPNTNRAGLYVAENVPAGGAGTIIATFNIALTRRCGVAFWRQTGFNPNRVVDGAGFTNTDAAAIPLTAPAGGSVIVYSFAAHSSAVTATIAGATERFDRVVEAAGFCHAGGDGAAAGAITPSIDWSATPVNGLATVAAVFGP